MGSKLRLGGRTDDVVAIAAESAVETPNDSTTEVPPPFESVLALQRRTLAADPIVENVVLTPVTASSGAGSETDGLNVAAPDADPFSTLDTPTRALPTEPIGTRSSPAEPVSVEAIASEPIAPQPATKTRPISALEAAAAAAGRWPESVPRPASETSARTNPLRFETPPPRTERPGLSIFQLPAAPPPPAGNSWDLDDEAADSFEDQNLDTSETTRDEDFRDFAVTHQPKDGVPPPTPVFQDDFQDDFQNDFDDDFDTAADSSDRPKSVELDNSIAEWPIVAEETLDHDFASIPLTGIRHDDDFDDLDTSIDADLFAELDEEAPPYVRARTAAATSVAVTAPLLATLRTHPADPALTSPRVTEFDELWDDADTGSIAASSLDALLDDDTTVAPPPPATSLLPPPATSKARTAPVLAKPVRHTDTAKSSELPMTRLFLGSGLALAALSALRVVLALLSTLTASTDQSNRGDRFVDAAKVLGPVHGLLLVVATALILLGHYVGRDRLESVANLTGRGCGVIIATSAVTVMMAVATLVSDISDNGAWGASLQAVVDFAVLGGAAAVAAGMAWSATNDVT